MIRNLGRIVINVCAAALLLVPAAKAQDMTGAAVTNPPAPVADGYATFTGTYENLGPGPAADVNVNFVIPIQPETWPPEGDGFAALLESTLGTDTNGNDVFWAFESDRMCTHYMLQLQMPNTTGDQFMIPNPLPAGAGGSTTWQMPVIPMEGVSAGRVVITEPESLRNSYGMAGDSWVNWPIYYQHTGAMNLVAQAIQCEDGGANCVDLDACLGDRLWSIEPFEEDVVIVDDGGVNPDPTLGCGPLVNAAEVAGKVAIARRGTCTFVTKMDNAQNAGAAGLIMVNNGLCSDDPDADPEECTILWGGAAGEGYLYDLPTVLMGRRQGEELIAAIDGGQTVRAAMGPVPDDVVDVGTWIFSAADDPDLVNDYVITRVPLGEMGPTSFVSFIPAAAFAAGAGGSFFQTDVDINNKGAADATVTFGWLPRGADNSTYVTSDPILLPAGHSVQYENVLNAVFGLTSDPPGALGAIVMIADSPDVIGMSRTYAVAGANGNFGQGLPAVPAANLIPTGVEQRIIFMSQNDDIRANVGCQNGLATPVHIDIAMYDAAGTELETRTMDLGPWSNNQISRIFQAYQPVNGYVDVWTDTPDAAFTCYGSVLDNRTDDPTTVLPQVPSADSTFIPAAALAAGLEGAFFQTDVDLNNAGATAAEYQLAWLPRGADNSAPTMSDPFTLEPGASVRYENVLSAVFGQSPNQVGALEVMANSPDVLVMSRTYNLLAEGNPLGFPAGATFGQELPGIPADMMITTGVKKRIIFMNENDDVRANVGCQSGVDTAVTVTIEMHDAASTLLETKFMALPPRSNKQLTQIFEAYSPVNGYVDIWTTTPDATIYCYGSVLDNINSDPTTVLPQ